jgi:hypothetical protein
VVTAMKRNTAVFISTRFADRRIASSTDSIGDYLNRQGARQRR